MGVFIRCSLSSYLHNGATTTRPSPGVVPSWPLGLIAPCTVRLGQCTDQRSTNTTLGPVLMQCTRSRAT